MVNFKQIKESDVFHFRYSSKNPNYNFLTHCFQGSLIALKNKEGKIVLADTYWGIGDRSGRVLDEKTIRKEVKSGGA